MVSRPPESEARVVISVMLALTAVVMIFVAGATALGTTARSTILIVWIGIMLAVLRRYRL